MTLILQKYMSDHLIHISMQRDTCQIWMWYSVGNQCFDNFWRKGENDKIEEIAAGMNARIIKLTWNLTVGSGVRHWPDFRTTDKYLL